MAKRNQTSNRGQTTGMYSEETEPFMQDIENQGQRRQGGSGTVEQVKQQTGELTEQAKRKASEKVDEAQHQAQLTFESQKQRTAERLGSVASALRDTSHRLHEQDEEMVAHYADRAAEWVEQASDYLNHRSLNELWHSANDLARRQPEVVVAGALAAGFLFGRFLKSSNRETQQWGMYQEGQWGMAQENQYGNAGRYGVLSGEAPRYDPTYGYRQSTGIQSDMSSGVGGTAGYGDVTASDDTTMYGDAMSSTTDSGRTADFGMAGGSSRMADYGATGEGTVDDTMEDTIVTEETVEIHDRNDENESHDVENWRSTGSTMDDTETDENTGRTN
jgi:hypothetical protein